MATSESQPERPPIPGGPAGPPPSFGPDGQPWIAGGPPGQLPAPPPSFGPDGQPWIAGGPAGPPPSFGPDGQPWIAGGPPGQPPAPPSPGRPNGHPWGIAFAAAVPVYFVLLMVLVPGYTGSRAYITGELIWPPILGALAAGGMARESRKVWRGWTYIGVVAGTAALVVGLVALSHSL